MIIILIKYCNIHDSLFGTPSGIRPLYQLVIQGQGAGGQIKKARALILLKHIVRRQEIPSKKELIQRHQVAAAVQVAEFRREISIAVAMNRLSACDAQRAHLRFGPRTKEKSGKDPNRLISFACIFLASR